MQPTLARTKPSWTPYLKIARFDHWVKNVFVLPGILTGVAASGKIDLGLGMRTALGLVAVGLIASSNYIINEIMDAPFDRYHPTKRMRPIPAGLVSVPIAYCLWIAFMLAGMAAAWVISIPFAASLGALWLMGICYNIPPLRTKDVPYLDVISEAVNNPLRMLAGWYITRTPSLPPGSLLVCYWMIGAYFMGIKRFAEYREIGNPAVSAAYRRSFAHYDEPRLLVSVMFYAAFAMLTFGAFLVRYRMELVLSFPLVAVVMAVYLKLAFEPNSAVQNPEYLYKEKRLLIPVTICAVALIALLFVDLPVLHHVFSPRFSGIAPAQP
ncbi:MAG: UbiA prenyltransferase family protein [Acidobacteriia bacterium]|nr:UbiA prenyltransferase family protein [Terriglobia bacterium]